AYGFALLGNAAGRVLTTMSYAIGDAATPARYAIYRVVASTAGALGLMQLFDVMGVVIGAVIAAWVETLALGLKLRKPSGGLALEQIPIAKTLLPGVCSVGPAVLLRALLPSSLDRSRLVAALILAVFGGAFAVFAPLLGLFDVRSLLRRRRR